MLTEIYKETPIGPIPQDWEAVPLSSVFAEVDYRVRNFEGGNASEFEVLSLTKNFGLILQSERFKSRIATEDVSNYKVVQRGQLVYNPYVIWEGAVHVLRNFDFGLVSPAYPVLEAKQGVADPYFLDDMLRTPLAIAAYNRYAAGAVNRRRAISKRDFGQILIPLPPLPEQRLIAYVLSTVRRSVEASERVIAAARELQRSLMKYLFTYGPVPIDQADQVVLKDTEVGKVPEGWEVVQFGSIIDIKSGQVDPREPPYNDMLHIGPENIEEATGRLLALQSAKELKLISGKYLFTSNDVVYSKIRPYLRKATLPGFTGICSADMYPLRPMEGRLSINYIFHYLLSDIFTRQAISHQSRTGIPKINRVQLNSTVIPVPGKGSQLEIANFFSAIDRKIEGELKSKMSLETLFNSLLHHLMTGKVQVADLPIVNASEETDL